jgi:hypothetical protein
MELTEEYQLLCLKNKLQTNLKYYLLGTNKPYITLYRIIDLLKNKHTGYMKDLEILNQNITSYANGQEMRVEDWLFNWNNKYVITELNNFVDISRNYELEEQIKDLQKQINEVKEINIEQNKRIEIIEEYVKPNK